jgi:hypothetical protein
VVREPEIRQELRGQVVRPLHQPLTNPSDASSAGFFVVDVSPRSIVGIPAPARLETSCVLLHGADGRGRDEDCSSPPAQIPACAANTPGSSLRSNVGGTWF